MGLFLLQNFVVTKLVLRKVVSVDTNSAEQNHLRETDGRLASKDVPKISIQFGHMQNCSTVKEVGYEVRIGL
jgi:hypothetical protein